MLLISKRTIFSVTDFVDLSASTSEWLSVTQVISVGCFTLTVVSSECSVDRKMAFSIPCDMASVSPVSILCTTLLTHFDCHASSENLPLFPTEMMRSLPCVPPSDRFLNEESLNTISFKAVSLPRYWKFKATFVHFSFHTIKFASCKVCTVAVFIVDAKLLALNIPSGLSCRATQRIWPILDLSRSLSLSSGGWIFFHSSWRLYIYRLHMLILAILMYLHFLVSDKKKGCFNIPLVFMFLTSHLESISYLHIPLYHCSKSML